VLAAATATTACTSGSATGPSSNNNSNNNAPPSRVVSVTGNLAFGEVLLGSFRDATMTIANSGNAPLAVSGLSVTGGLASHITASWTSGTIAAGGSQAVNVRFAPTAAGSFSGTMVVNTDSTSGANSVAISGTAFPSFAGTWTGAHVSTACNGTGSAQDLICGATRGAYKVGTSLVFSVTLNQTGSQVSGTANLGGPTGPVTGTITGDTLTLSGTVRDNQGFTAVISSWSTRVTTSAMTGTVGYNLTYSGLPGNAGIVANLSNVTKR
jgi:hypothetical protein